MPRYFGSGVLRDVGFDVTGRLSDFGGVLSLPIGIYWVFRVGVRWEFCCGEC